MSFYAYVLASSEVSLASPGPLRSWERHSPGQVQKSSDTGLCVSCLVLSH